jgi:ribosomal-protein-serine acetyltransferase
LRELTAGDAEDYVSVMAANASHLTRLGDFTEEVQTSAREYAARFAVQGPALAFGIWDTDQLVGSVELVPVDPPRYGLGYWLAESACGRGLATLAVEAITRYAERDLGATDIFAGVTHGNDKSIAVLERARFNIAAGRRTRPLPVCAVCCTLRHPRLLAKPVPPSLPPSPAHWFAPCSRMS